MSILGTLVALALLVFAILKNRDMLSSLLPAWLVHGDKTTPGPNIKHESAENDVEETEDAETTPKATAVDAKDDVPTFVLSDGSENEQRSEPASLFPAANSAQRASTASSRVSKDMQSKPPQQSLMPPPARPATLSVKGSPAGSLRIPSTGPLPNRGPPANSQQRASGGLSASGAVGVPNARGKVQLSPGHSPMDWAALTRSGNISGVSGFQRVTPSQLRAMTGRKGKPAWSSWQGKVYNITPYLPFHPGGEAELMKAAGRDGTKLFMDVHPWVNWENMLGSCVVGVLVPEDYANSPLEDMD